MMTDYQELVKRVIEDLAYGDELITVYNFSIVISGVFLALSTAYLTRKILRWYNKKDKFPSLTLSNFVILFSFLLVLMHYLNKDRIFHQELNCSAVETADYINTRLPTTDGVENYLERMEKLLDYKEKHCKGEEKSSK